MVPLSDGRATVFRYVQQLLTQQHAKTTATPAAAEKLAKRIWEPTYTYVPFPGIISTHLHPRPPCRQSYKSYIGLLLFQ
jgi:hypothetical protein